mgnify:CR=1 FL=1
MLCVDCRVRPAMYKRGKCNLCVAGKPPAPAKATPYHPDDHVGKREALRKMIKAARKAGEL